MKKNMFPIIVLFFAFTSCVSEKPIEIPASRTDINSAPAPELYSEIFSDGVFHQFIVIMTRAEWNGMTQDMLDYAKEHPVTLFYQGDGRPYRTGSYRKASLLYKRPNGEDVFLRDIGIRTRGNESRRLPMENGRYQKSHFKLKFDETFDLEKGSAEFKQRDKRSFAGMKALDFKWSRYGSWDTFADMTKIKELYSYRLLEKVGVPVPKMSTATLTFVIDGVTVRYGMYGIVEHIDDEFITKRFGAEGSDGDLYKCLYLELGNGPHLTIESLGTSNIGLKNYATNYRPIYDLKTNKKTSDHSALRDFVTKLNSLEGDAFIDYMEKHFETDQFIRFLAMGIYINNLDDYRFLANNYYLYFNPKGKISFIPYDSDISLGGGWHGEMDYKAFINMDIFNTKSMPEAWGDRSKRPLVDKLLEIDKYRTRYVALLKEYIDPANKLFLYSEYKKKFEEVFALYQGQERNDTNDTDPLGWKGFEKDYFHDKTRSVLDQLKVPYTGYELE
jgi:spore coat protein H